MLKYTNFHAMLVYCCRWCYLILLALGCIRLGSATGATERIMLNVARNRKRWATRNYGTLFPLFRTPFFCFFFCVFNIERNTLVYNTGDSAETTMTVPEERPVSHEVAERNLWRHNGNYMYTTYDVYSLVIQGAGKQVLVGQRTASYCWCFFRLLTCHVYVFSAKKNIFNAFQPSPHYLCQSWRTLLFSFVV